MRRSIIFLILICLAGNVSGQTLMDSIVAVVAEDALTHSELQDAYHLEALIDGAQVGTMPTVAEKRAHLDTLINRTFVLQEASRRGIVVIESDTQVAAKIAAIAANTTPGVSFQTVLGQYHLERAAVEAHLRDELIYDEFYRRIFFNAVSSEKVATSAKLYYEVHSAAFIVPSTVTFKSLRIVTPKNVSATEKAATAARIQKLTERLQGGETFQAVYETDKTTLEITYEVLTVAAETPLGRSVTELPVAEPSQPFPIPGGYQIVERIRNEPSYQRTYEEAREEISDEIRNQLATAEFEMWLSEQKAETTWHIFDDALAKELDETE